MIAARALVRVVAPRVAARACDRVERFRV